ncbi:ABC transporter ATP-binding protein [Thermoflavimicrobium daqui]|uniref:Multidrug ABC transporter permease/ATP-binding protein n=1 Tax=Thermoflavimicrobium daqui TaxID=2137476 RepID=A0A364K8H9_9BACL|nr:ABC transporter transmembrane domain-containing protein [Thermoflavimicrobium daqui]RAL26605.1 multidrug ABC transporter permease/ATP-binding protein [Thermoflavimicrobium daqui]
MSIFKDLWWFFKREKKSYLLGIGTLLIMAVLSLFPPYAIRNVVDLIVTKKLTMDDLLYWSVLCIGVGLVQYGMGFYWRIQLFGAANRLGQLLRNRLYAHFTKMAQPFYHKHRTGDLMAHATNDIQAITLTSGEGVLTLADSISTGSAVILTMALFIDWQLTLIVLIPMPIMAALSSYYGSLLHQRFHIAQEAFSDTNDKVQENISGMRVIKAFGQEENEKKVFKSLLDNVVEKNIAVAKVDALFDPTIILCVGISFFLSIAFGSKAVIEGHLTIGELTQFTIYLGYLVWPMLAFGWLFNIVERGRASYDRIQNLLNIRPDIQDHEQVCDEVPTGEINYQLQSFSFPEDVAPTLHDIFVQIKRGETLGIVGKTGSGKTTFLRLLLREFEAHPEAICMGGRPITQYPLSRLREAIGYVPQDHVLFSGTITENIAFGRPDASFEEVEKVAKIACIHEDILQFEHGYETIVGEKGVTLSGGQKQRISIARALLLDPEILILDDSLSAVDAKTETSILQALRENRAQKTTLISAHRLSAVEKADQIIVLEQGRIIEHGTHEELMMHHGWYREMYERQQLESLVLEGGK